jgi:hypothetical protein
MGASVAPSSTISPLPVSRMVTPAAEPPSDSVLPKAEPPPSELTERGVDGCCRALLPPSTADAGVAALLPLAVLLRAPRRLVLLLLWVM